MKKYDISTEYGIFAKFTPPFHKILFPVSSLILAVIPQMLKSSHEVEITKQRIKTDDDAYINLYLFNPVKSKTDKAFLYIHGGGFAFKGYFCHYELCRRFAGEGDCKVVYVDYRLSPKYKYPVPLNDCFDAYKWILKHADKLKINADKIIVGGDSAGGCLAVDVAFKAIQKNLVRPCYQMLVYPVLDKRMNTRSMKIYSDTPMWNSRSNRKMWKYYLGNSYYISPNERLNLSNMPPTYLETAEYDCLHDEGIEFAKKLMDHGIPVELYETKQTMHGYNIKNCSITEKAIQKRIQVLKEIPGGKAGTLSARL